MTTITNAVQDKEVLSVGVSEDFKDNKFEKTIFNIIPFLNGYTLNETEMIINAVLVRIKRECPINTI